MVLTVTILTIIEGDTHSERQKRGQEKRKRACKYSYPLVYFLNALDDQCCDWGQSQELEA